MTKSQLQPGMLAVTRNGNEYLVLPGLLLGLTTPGTSLIAYEEDLTVLGSTAFDIVQAYTCTAKSINTLQDTDFRTLIW